MPLTAPTLSLVDNADGSGALATLAGGDAAATNTVYVQSQYETAFSSKGSRTGDGTVSLTLVPGFLYAAYCSSTKTTETAVSNLVCFFGVTNGVSAVHDTILTAVLANAQALTLAELPASQMYKLRDPTAINVTMPALLICPGPDERIELKTNLRDDIEYPVLVAIASRDAMASEANLARDLRWREQLINYFRQPRLSGYPDGFFHRIEPKVIFDPADPAYQIISSAFLLFVRGRIARGVT